MTIQKRIYLLFIAITATDCAKILITVTTPSPSLFNLYKPIIAALAARNHDITLQTYYPMPKPVSNVKELTLQPPQFGDDEDMTKDLLLKLAAAGPLTEVLAFSHVATIMCEEYLTDPTTKTLLKSGKQFDLVLADGFADCALAAAPLLGKHIAMLFGSGNAPWIYTDLPSPPSYVPNYFRRIPSKMTFWQRLNNVVDISGSRLITDYMMVPSLQKQIDEHLPHAPTIREARDKVCLTLANSDPVMYSARPSMPDTINCGGLHCTDAKPLPKELNDFVESSGYDGFIIFGLGSNMKSKFLPPQIRDAILSAFSRLKQKVIWKFEAQLDNLPKNVIITKWMPQQDLLGHPKCRLFITHAGLLSLQESVYHGVPVIGMPLFMDQNGNIARVEELGIGAHMDLFDVTSDGLYRLINKVLTDKSYRANAKKYSAIFKDQPVTPLNNAIYWLEYVIRHDGMDHFRSAARDLNLFQYFLLDVIAVLLLVAILVIGFLYFVVTLIFRKLCQKKQSVSLKEKKKK